MYCHLPKLSYHQAAFFPHISYSSNLILAYSDDLRCRQLVVVLYRSVTVHNVGPRRVGKVTGLNNQAVSLQLETYCLVTGTNDGNGLQV